MTDGMEPVPVDEVDEVPDVEDPNRYEALERLTRADRRRMLSAMRARDRARIDAAMADGSLSRLLLDLAERYECSPEQFQADGSIDR